MTQRFLPLFLFCLLSLLTWPQQGRSEEGAALAIHTGAFDFNKRDNPATEFGLEYRFTPRQSLFYLIPVIGLTANTDGGHWLYSGMRYDIRLSDRWILSPHLAASLYGRGHSKNLGYGLEFRSGLELAYHINAHSHLGLGIYHLSNAGLGRNNPGEESLIISYSFSPDILY